MVGPCDPTGKRPPRLLGRRPGARRPFIPTDRALRASRRKCVAKGSPAGAAYSMLHVVGAFQQRAGGGEAARPRTEIQQMPRGSDITPSDPARGRAGAIAGGFTLLESLIAASLLVMVVLAVITGVTTAQQVSFEGQKRILGAMAADDLMGELVTLPYADLKDRDGWKQAPGAMTTLDGQAYPTTNWAVGRSVSVQEEIKTEPALGVSIKGLRVIVTAQDADQDLLSIEMFVPEPAS